MSYSVYVPIRHGPLKGFMEVYGYTDANEEAAILDYIQKIGVQEFLTEKQAEEYADMFLIFHKLEPNTVVKFVDRIQYRRNIRNYISIKMGDPNWFVGSPIEGE